MYQKRQSDEQKEDSSTKKLCQTKIESLDSIKDNLVESLDTEFTLQQFFSCMEEKNGTTTLRRAPASFDLSRFNPFGLVQKDIRKYDYSLRRSTTNEDVKALKFFSCISPELVNWVKDRGPRPETVIAFEARRSRARPELSITNSWTTNHWGCRCRPHIDYASSSRSLWYADASYAIFSQIASNGQSGRSEDGFFDLLIVHLNDSSVKFDLKRTMELRTHESFHFSRLVPDDDNDHCLPTATVMIPVSIVNPDSEMSFQDTRPKPLKQAVLKHQILARRIVNVGNIDSGFKRCPKLYKDITVEIWFVATTMIESPVYDRFEHEKVNNWFQMNYN